MLRYRSFASILVPYLFALTQACGDDTAEPAKSRDAGLEEAKDAAMPAEKASAIDPSCAPPPDCLPIQNLINIDACCSETLRCGWDISDVVRNASMYPDQAAALASFDIDADKPCVPRGVLFFEAPSQPAKRVPAPGGDILLTPDCTSRTIANSLLAGCCLPDDTCGLSTQGALSAFKALLAHVQGDPTEPFTSPECVSPKALNAQLADSKLEAWAFIPASEGACSYAALDAMLTQ